MGSLPASVEQWNKSVRNVPPFCFKNKKLISLELFYFKNYLITEVLLFKRESVSAYFLLVVVVSDSLVTEVLSLHTCVC